MNVDAYDEDNYEDDTEADAGSISADVTAREAETRKLLNAGNKTEALRAALRNPPVNSKNAQDKVLSERFWRF